MKKNDKIIAVAGVIILIIASIGVYTWSPSGVAEDTASIDSFLSITSSFSDCPKCYSCLRCKPVFST